MSTVADRPLRIGELAQVAGTTTRTIRYYEEIGLLPAADARAPGSHRLYGPGDVGRLTELVRLKDLLGLTLDELGELMAAEDARASLRDEWHEGTPEPGRRREILDEAVALIDRQLTLVRRRRDEIASLEAELHARRASLGDRLEELDTRCAATSPPS